MPQDLRRAVRLAARRPGAWTLLVLTLALGIAAPTVAFSLADAVLWHPLPFRSADRLVRIRAGGDAAVFADSPAAHEWFAGVFPFGLDGATIETSDGAEGVTVGELSPGLIAALGVAPAIGRPFAADDFTGDKRVVIVSAALGRKLQMVGSDAEPMTLRLDGVRETVVGIMPDGFDFPVGRVALWRPVPSAAPGLPTALGLLKPGLTPARLMASRPAWPGNAHVTPFAVVSPATITAVGTFAGAAALLFIIAIANATGLQLAAAVEREGELAVRAALGASPRQLARTILTEHFVATCSATAVAWIAGLWALAAIVRAVPYLISFQTLRPVQLDGRALAVSALAALGAGAVASWASLWRLRGVEPSAALGAGSRGSQAHARGRAVLAAAAIAVVVPIVACAGLLFNSLLRLSDLDPGYPTTGITRLALELPAWHYQNETQRREARERLRDALRALPTVSAVSVADTTPPELDRVPLAEVVVDGETSAPAPGFVSYDSVDSAFFSTLGIPIVAGRAFDSRDREGAQIVAIVSRSLALRLWPALSLSNEPAFSSPTALTANVLGRRFKTSPTGPWRTVVGVAGDVTAVLADRTRDTMTYYLPGAQTPASSMVEIIVRARAVSRPLAGAMRDTARRVLPDAPVIELGTVAEMLQDGRVRERFLTAIVGAVALAALMLALVGVYAMFWTSVRQRTREFGIRLALGATPSRLTRRVLGASARIALAGLAVGMPLGLAATRALGAWLFQVLPDDPSTHAVVAAGVLAAAVAASYGPARRAARIDPVRALRDH